MPIAYVSRVERGEVSPTFDWVERALAAMGEELALGVRRSRFDDHDPAAHRLVGAWDPDRRLEDFVASAGVLDELAGSPEASTARADPDERPRAGPFRPDALAGVLNAHGVDYVVVGGVAAIRHGSRRTTRELDIVPAPSPANSRRLAAALKALHARARGVDPPGPGGPARRRRRRPGHRPRRPRLAPAARRDRVRFATRARRAGSRRG